MKKKSFADEIRDEIAEETRRSRYRDRTSGRRVHPIEHDIRQLLDFVASRRLRHPGVGALVLRIRKRVDTQAVRQLVDVVYNGRYTRVMRWRCERLLGYCAAIETALWIEQMLNRESCSEETPNAAN